MTREEQRADCFQLAQKSKLWAFAHYSDDIGKNITHFAACPECGAFFEASFNLETFFALQGPKYPDFSIHKVLQRAVREHKQRTGHDSRPLGPVPEWIKALPTVS